MKTIFKITALIGLGLAPTRSEAQTQINICAGSSGVISIVNSQGLTSPTYSMNPGGLSSTTGSFFVTPPTTTTYTLYVTGTNSNSAVVTSSITTTVQVEGVTYSVVSADNFTLGCITKSVCQISILNANTFPMGGGAVTYTFLPPGSSTVIGTGTLGTQNITNVITPGPWVLVVRSNTNLCTAWDTINIVNVGAPQIGNVIQSHSILSCYNPTDTLKVAANPNYQFNWLPGNVKSNSLAVQCNTAAPNLSLVAVYTLVVTDNSSVCQTTVSTTVYQNLFAPTAIISGSGALSCNITPSITLTNQSKTNIPKGSIFPTNLPANGYLWEGPAPQVPLSNSTSYVAKTPGIYTLTAMDMNNGCTDKTTTSITLNVPFPIAAFAHTITNGTAQFNNLSTGSYSGTTYLWDFGDGNTSTLQHPTHNYVSSGAFLVKLKIKNIGNTFIYCADSVIQSINVSGIPCTANSGFSMVPTSTAQVWNVVPAYPWNVTAATWDWGDNSGSNTLYSSHQYSAAGMYNICLSVTVSCVASSSTCTSYSVFRSSQAALIISVNVMSPELISGLVQADQVKQLSWNITPNPNSGEFQLNLENAGTSSVRILICDLMGRNVLDRSAIDNSSTSIDIKDLPSGLYLVTLEVDGLRTTKRLVLNH